MATEKLIIENLDVWTTAIKRRSTAGRGSSRKIELYGIKKLRDLILELAVRGLLVPQDPNDEPARETLRMIAAEKTKLAKEGKIKKEKPLLPIRDEEKPYSLPESWEWCRVTDLAVSQAGFAFKSNAFNESGEGLPLIRIRDVGQPFSGTYYNGDYREEFLVKNGDYLISMDGNFRVSPWTGGDALLNQRVSRLIFHVESIAKRFVAESLQIRLLELQGIKAYTTVDHLSGGQISESVIAFPPLAEQHRIVAKVDELMALCDQLETKTDASLNAHQTLVETLLSALIGAADHTQFASAWQRIAEHFDILFTTEESIDQLKQTILQLAVMGKLVPPDPNDEPASELLKKITAEKARLVKEGKIKKDKPLPPVAKEEKPFHAPDYWEFVRLLPLSYEIGTGPFGSMIHQSDYVDGGVPLINPSHMVNDLIVEDAAVAVDQKKAGELSNYRVYSGDIVLARRGEVGRCAIVTGREDGWLCGTGSFYLRLPPDVSRKFMALVFRASSTRKYLVGKAVGATMANLNHGILNNLPIGIPPINEQHRIVAKVDKLMEICDQLAMCLMEVQTTQLHLADALTEQTLAGT